MNIITKVIHEIKRHFAIYFELSCRNHRCVTAYELHGIVDTQPGIYRPSGSIEIYRYIFTRVGRIELKQLCFYNIRCIIIDRRSQKAYKDHH